VRCSRCKGENLVKDGTSKYPFNSPTPYGLKQRFKCKDCKKLNLGAWVFFNKKLYDQYTKQKFKQFLDSRHVYQDAKDQSGYGGFRLSDL